ncbi:type IV secretion protein Rhs, partial [Myroides sp. TSA_177.3]
MDGSTRQITVNGNVIADFNKKGSIQQDGVMVWGTGADPMDSAIGRDRGQGSIEVGDSDVNAFYALMNKVLSYFKDEVIKSNKATESATPLKSSQEKSETMTFKMKGYQNKDLFDRSDEATVRWS